MCNLLTSKTGLCILNMNIQNVFAKFDLFSLFIERVTVSNPISVICLNECWINEKSDISDINLPNYTMFIQRGNRKGHGHCGLITYVHEQFQGKEPNIVRPHTALEYMSVEISHNKPNSKKYIISNVYRLPVEKVEDYTIVTDEFSCFLNDVKI